MSTDKTKETDKKESPYQALIRRRAELIKQKEDKEKAKNSKG